MGPQSQPGNSTCRAAAGVSLGSVGPIWRSAAVGGRTFPGERHHRFSGGQKPVWKVGTPSGVLIARRGVGPLEDRGNSPFLPSALGVRSTRVDCPQCSRTACVWRPGKLGGAPGDESVGSPSDPS
jgi:hypothetical protein